ncbi:MAG TPA: hypothetical protein PLB78_01295, partial [Anaerolineae bacterium]|nr:hypothetical protein [Anaerolineae bacterium]
PYGYVQMAVDLMRHGTLLHRFPLALLAGQLGIDAEPLLHVGYRLPLDAGGWAATVWPAGHSVLLGLAGRLAGERAVYLGTPLLALASIAATAWLGALVCDDLPAPLGWLAGSLAGLIVATSFEQLRWVLVHMADVSAQLFSTLTLALVWRGVGNPLPFPPRGGMGSRRQRPAPGDRAEGGQQRGEPAQFPPAGGTVGGHRRRLWLVAAGLALALAYWARHTQLAMALPALAIIVLTGGRASPTGLAGRGAWPAGRLCDGTIYLGAALLGALPDLAYHAALFGSPLCPESKELALYTLRAIPASSALLVRGWLDARELAWLAPFLLAGAVALWRRNRRAALMVALWLAGLWAVQAPYSSLRLRDLLPALPALALVTGYGIVRALGWAARRRRPVAAFAALAIVALLWLRSVDTAALPWRRNFNNFGYLWPTQRAEFARLQGLLEPGAAVGATLNTGAIDLYGGHEAFLAAAWAPGDLQRFLQALWQAGTPTYLLDDGSDMDQVLAAVRAYARVGPAATLRAVPYYAPDGGSELRDVVVYWVRAE